LNIRSAEGSDFKAHLAALASTSNWQRFHPDGHDGHDGHDGPNGCAAPASMGVWSAAEHSMSRSVVDYHETNPRFTMQLPTRTPAVARFLTPHRHDFWNWCRPTSL